MGLRSYSSCVCGHQLIVFAGNESCLACDAASAVCLGAGVLRVRVCIDEAELFVQLRLLPQGCLTAARRRVQYSCLCLFAWGNRI